MRQKILGFTRKSLQVAHWLGLDAYLFVPGSGDVFFDPYAEVVQYDQCYTRAQETISALQPAAESLGVAICVENVWNKFLLSPLEMQNFIDSFHSSQVGVYCDVGNVLAYGYPTQWIRILGNRIRRAHFNTTPKPLSPPEGANPYPQVCWRTPFVPKKLAV